MTVESGNVFDLQVSSAYRIGDGGLLRRFEVASRLTRLRTQLITILLFTWFPIVTLGLAREHLTGQSEPMIYDPAMHVRLLVAIPVFLILDDLFPAVCGYVITLLMAQNFVPPAEHHRLERVLENGARLANSSAPEALLAVACLGIGVGGLLGMIPLIGIDHRDLSPAQTWYALTDLPLFQFLLWRSLWRWAIWVKILLGISRIKLDLVPTHPDKRGGIRFLRLPSVGYCAMLLFAISSVLCAEWRGRFTLGATISSFTPLLLAFSGAGFVIAFGPLFLFVVPLYRAKRIGIAEVGGIATEAGRRFRQQCLDTTLERDRVDVHALAAVEQTFRETVDQLKVVLFDRNDVLILLIATLTPLVPVMLLYVPFEDWRNFAGAAVGFR
jgi:hypothetical protein